MIGKEPTKKPVLLPPTYFLIALIVAVGLHFLFPVLHIIGWPYNLSGILPVLFGIWITVWADQIFKRRGTTVQPHLDSSVLVTDGPFRISRHPMYLGMVLVVFGVCILLGSLTPFAAPLALALLFQIKFLPMEEESMIRVFGRQYESYKKEVRAWL